MLTQSINRNTLLCLCGISNEMFSALSLYFWTPYVTLTSFLVVIFVIIDGAFFLHIYKGGSRSCFLEGWIFSKGGCKISIKQLKNICVGKASIYTKACIHNKQVWLWKIIHPYTVHYATQLIWSKYMFLVSFREYTISTFKV